MDLYHEGEQVIRAHSADPTAVLAAVERMHAVPPLAKVTGPPVKPISAPQPVQQPATAGSGATSGAIASQLSTVQVRSLFSQYLWLVRDRMLKETASHEQIDLVVKFLARASLNLPAHRVNVLPSSVALRDRQISLAAELSNFLGLYDNETRKLTQSRGGMPTGASEGEFRTVLQGDEGTLEAVLTSYARVHKSPGVFLGEQEDPIAAIERIRIRHEAPGARKAGK